MNKPRLPEAPIDLHPYLNEIAERLFSGHAAVMVGAGFSKNAKRHHPSCPDFPDWSDLGDLFYEKLHYSKPNIHNRYLSVPKLAHEVEAAIGRPALDQLLRDAIPDQDYDPSHLHTKLLDLPWTDVFTTNYDTLLERTCGSVTSQRYDVVVNLDDLVYSETPRIVKLHGSFPADRPFIVTDEDYRRYPDTFAPFVNTVRQALLENTLCLIGFSGDDPNFLQWIGWIHDNLGRRHSPRVYLIGMLRLSDSQRRLLERRNIVSVDISEYDDVDGDDPEGALERFFDYLESRKRDFNPRDWPRNGYPHRQHTNDSKVSKIRRVLPMWKADRRSFPGWLIVPEARRRVLWQATRDWLMIVPDSNELPRFLDLEFAFEMVWRMEKCHSPIFDNQIEFLEATVERYLTTDTSASLESPAPAGMQLEAAAALSRSEVSDMCHHLLLSFLRYYRQEGNLEEWARTSELLDGLVTKMSPDHRARLHFERALLALFELNPDLLKQRIDEWPVDRSLPFWEARRAGLLAEIGRVNDAGRILEDALVVIRSRSNLKPVTTDYSLVSQESFVMLLLRAVRRSSAVRAGKFGKLSEVSKAFSDRWDALRQYDCDPWNELEIFERSLDRPPVYVSHLTESPGFDIGHVTVTHHMGGDNHEGLAAYEFLLFCEDAGLPFRMPGLSIAEKSAVGAMSRISRGSPYWAVATLVRIGKDNVVDRIFDRPSLARMDVASVDALIDRFLNLLELATTELDTRTTFWDDNVGTLVAKVVPEILSRLCGRCSRAAHERLFDFLLSTYRSDRRANYRGVKHLSARLIETASFPQRIELIPRLLKFPILSGLSPIEEVEYVSPFMFVEDWDSALSGRRQISHEDLDRFIDAARSDDAERRKWGTLTLGTLYAWGLLEAKTTGQFASALWGRLNDADLPMDTYYYPHGFLTLPHPPEVDPLNIFKRWVRGQQFPLQKDGTTVRIDAPIPICDAIIGASRSIKWTCEEAQSIFDGLVEWWDTDKSRLSVTSEIAQSHRSVNTDSSISGEFRRRFSRLADTLVALMTSMNLKSFDDETQMDSLERVADEMNEHGLPILRLEMAYTYKSPEKRDNVVQRIERAMASSHKDTVVDALKAVSVLSEKVPAELTDRERGNLVHVLSVVAQMLLWRRETGLQPVIDTISRVIRRHPWSFRGGVERSVLEGLRHLIRDTTIRSTNLPRFDERSEGADVSLNLILRCAGARLAYTLFEHYSKIDTSIPATVCEWRTICRSDDEFAEIRNQWKELSAQ